MKKGDKVWFKAAGFRAGTYTVVSVFDDANPPVVKIAYGSFGPIAARQSECELCLERNARLEAEALAEAKLKYDDVIKAWESGARTLQDIAEKLGVPKIGLSPRVNAAKRKGLIHD